MAVQPNPSAARRGVCLHSSQEIPALAGSMIAKLAKRFATTFDCVNGGFAFAAGALLISMLLFICYAVVMRYFFRSPIAWMIEVSEDIVLYICFLGTAWVLKMGGHVSVDLVYDRLNPKTKLLLDIIVSAMGVIICLILTWYSGASTWDHFQAGILHPKVLKIPKAILLGIIPVGFLMLSLQFLRQASGYLVRWRTSGKKELRE